MFSPDTEREVIEKYEVEEKEKENMVTSLEGVSEDAAAAAPKEPKETMIKKELTVSLEMQLISLK